MHIKKLNQNGFHLIYLLLVLAVLGVIGFAGWRVYTVQQQNKAALANADKINRDDPFVKQYGSTCSNVAISSFPKSPIAVDQIRYIEPMGKMYDGHVTPVDHVYISPLDPNAADNSYSVVMPADGKVVEISRMPDSYIGDQTNRTVAPEDHRIVVSFNCRYYAIFIHVHQLSDKLAAAVTGLQAGQNKSTDISLKAGDTIGKIGGNPVDWTLVDVKTTLAGFIHPDSYEREPWKVHSIDPFSAYTDSLKSQLQAKSLRSAVPIGGKIDYDKAGTLAGNWFRQGTNGYAGTDPSRYWDGHLSIVPDYIDPNTTVVSIGNWQGTAKQFAVKGDADPSQVTVKNSPVKYELIELGYETPTAAPWDGKSLIKGLKVSQRATQVGTIMFEVQSDGTLKVEKFPGLSADLVSAFGANAQIYVR